MTVRTVNDTAVPSLGFGTARMDDHDVRVNAIQTALDAGYRHIDTAQMYGSEPAVGEAITASTIPQDELFITTKLTRDNRNYEAVIESTHASLDRLEVDYIDLLLIHSPDQSVPHEETLSAMNDLHAQGLIRHLGVSNFTVDQLANAIEVSSATIVTNQVKYHIEHRQDELLSYCLAESVILTAYSPLSVGELADLEVLTEIGQRYGKSWAQIALRWLLQHPLVATIPMSSKPSHIRENADVWDFSLTDEEMRRLFDVGGELTPDLARQLGL